MSVYLSFSNIAPKQITTLKTSTQNRSEISSAQKTVCALYVKNLSIFTTFYWIATSSKNGKYLLMEKRKGSQELGILVAFTINKYLTSVGYLTGRSGKQKTGSNTTTLSINLTLFLLKQWVLQCLKISSRKKNLIT